MKALPENTISRQHRYGRYMLTKLCGVNARYFPWSCEVDGRIFTAKTKKDLTELLDNY